jgi:hypothetical protein
LESYVFTLVTFNHRNKILNPEVSLGSHFAANIFLLLVHSIPRLYPSIS